MARREQRIEHLLRRVGFGGSSDDVSELADVGYHGAVDRLVFHELIADDVDSRIGEAGHVGVTTRSQFLPDTSINDARQRWLFRMVHTRKPLQEKMALFWHHHFATAHSKINGTYGGTLATRMMAATGSYNGASQTPAGQIELFRHEGLGSFYTLLVAVARDPAMLVWLDGRLNVKGKPQENFAREVMELFTMGLRASDDAPPHFTEDDVKAAAEVFTGWNLSIGDRGTNNANEATVPYGFLYRSDRHQDGPKTFSFAIYPDGGRTITSSGAQQGLLFSWPAAGIRPRDIVNGSYYRLMATLNDSLTAFYQDVQNQGLLGDTMVLQFSEFGRRVYENGSQGTDHGAGGVMMLMGGAVQGGLYGTAPDLADYPNNPTLESRNGDVRYQTDFRSVYARVLDSWLGTDSTTILGADFSNAGLTFV